MNKKLVILVIIITSTILINGFHSNMFYGTQYMSSKSEYLFSIASSVEWWDCNWSYNKKITIDHDKIQSTQTNYPVLIYRSSDTDLASNAQSDGGDIIFVDKYNTTQYKHEIESYNSSTGELTAWVKIPSISASSDTTLYIYYGNPTCSNQQNLTATWDSNFKMIQHFNESSGTLYDSTSNDNDGANNGATYNESAKIYGGYDFDGNDNITINEDSSLNITGGITLEGWVKDPPIIDIYDCNRNIEELDKKYDEFNRKKEKNSIIEIIKADHLNEKKLFVSDIYNKVVLKDNIWSGPIYNNEYVKITFESSIDKSNDIKIYAKSNSTSNIEVYKASDNSLVHTFENINGKNWYKIFLKNMEGSENTFYLKTIGDFVIYDYIVDPTGWVSPTGFADPSNQWSTESKAYDENTGTYASNTGAAGWRGYIELTLSSAIYCDRVRVFSDFGYDIVDQVDIDIYNSTSWIDKYQGAISDCEWSELSFSAETNVTKARFRYHYTGGGWNFWLYEFDFWEGQPITLPSCQTKNATSVDETSAILKGNVTDDGGEPCECRFQYGLDTSYGNDTDWTGSETTDDVFSKIISGLSLGNKYHYRAQIRNSKGWYNGSDKNFTTAVPSYGWVTPTSDYDPDSNWENENYSRDDDVDSYARHYHDINDADGQWSSFIYINHSAIYCDAVRFYARGLTGDELQVDRADLDVKIDGAWNNIFLNSFTDKTWIQCNFNQGTVDSARIRFRVNQNNGGLYYELFEFDFNKSRAWPNIQDESPSNESTGILIIPDLSIAVNSTIGENMNITWYSNSSDSWLPFGKNTSVGNGTYYQTNNNFSTNGTKYWWYVTVQDRYITNTSDTFHFTTRYEAEVLTNSSKGVEETNATLCGYLLHDGNESCTVRFEYGTTTSYGTNTSNQTKSEGDEFFENIVGLNPGTLYRYRTYSNNTIEYDNGDDVAFLTKPNVTENLQLTINSTSTLYLNWDKGDGANNTYIERNASGVTVWQRGTGIEVYNGTGSNYEDSGLLNGVTYYYQAWSYATWTYNPTLEQWSDENSSVSGKTKYLPSQSGESPTNESTNICPIPELNVTCIDNDGDTMNATWWSNSSNSWIQFASNSSISNNSNIIQTNTNFTNPGKTYYWSVNLSDGEGGWKNETYKFKTNYEPVLSNEEPNDGNTSEPLNVMLNTTITDTDGDSMNANWLSNSSGQWLKFATNNTVSSGETINQTNSNFSQYSKTYWWSINVTDGCNWTNATYSFTTRPTPTSPIVITNTTTGIKAQNATLNGFLQNNGKDDTECGFWWDTSSGGTTNNQSVGTVLNATTFSYNISGLSLTPGQLYYYKAWANNSAGFENGSEMTFLTKPNSTIAGSLSLQSNSSTIIYLTWTVGDGANKTYIERNASGVSSWERGQGTEIYNGTGTNFEDTGLSPGTTYYYQLWSYANWTYNPTLEQWSDENESGSNKTKNKPVITNVNPANQSIGIILNTTLEIQVNHSNGYTMNITWFWGTDSSCPNQIGTNSSVNNGTYLQPDSDENFSTNSQTYYWKVTINDGHGEWTNETYQFTTIGANKEIISKSQNTYSLELHPDGDILYGYINGNVVSTSIDTDIHYVVMTFDGSDIKLYIDGEIKDEASYSGSINTNSDDLILGDFLTGTLDEVRVSSTARSSEWINTTYQNTNQPNTFATFGTQKGVLSSWDYRKQIWINSSMIQASLTNFPILISTTDNDLKNNAQNSGNDIIFTNSLVSWTNDSYTDIFAHEIEKYDSSTGEIIAWVNVTSISSTTNTSIYMYYGNTQCNCNREDAAGVWDSNYVGVWHLNETGTGTRYDSTSNNNHGTPDGYNGDEAISNGKADGADDLDGNDDFLNVSDSSTLDITGSITVESFVFVESWPDLNWPIVSKRKQSGVGVDDINYMTAIPNDGDISGYYRDGDGNAQGYRTNETQVSSNCWYHIASTLTFGTANSKGIFVNGTEVNTSWVTNDGTTAVVTNNHKLNIGHDYYSTDTEHRYSDGYIDEVRISNIIRSDNWINSSYNTINDPGNFTAFGPQKTKNMAPTQSNPSPSNGAIGQDQNPTLSITVNDANSDKMNVTFWTNATGTWGLIGYNDSVYNGTYYQTNDSMDSYNTTYWWSVNATDYNIWSNQTYSFKTKDIATYYFNSYDSGGEEWETNPSQMTDDSLINYANTSSDAQVQLLDGNNCSGTNLGTITKVEIRAYGNNTNGLNSANITIRPVFDGTDDGDNHSWTTVGTSKDWSNWFDITTDTNSPGTWTWTNVTNLDCDIESDGTPNFNLACYKIELRVTYS